MARTITLTDEQWHLVAAFAAAGAENREFGIINDPTAYGETEADIAEALAEAREALTLVGAIYDELRD